MEIARSNRHIADFIYGTDAYHKLDNSWDTNSIKVSMACPSLASWYKPICNFCSTVGAIIQWEKTANIFLVITSFGLHTTHDYRIDNPVHQKVIEF